MKNLYFYLKQNIIVTCIIIALISSIITISIYIYILDGSRLYHSWVGYVVDWNLRDVGQSLNQCQSSYSSNIFYPLKTNLIYRSNKFFSSHNCSKISDINKIYSLNFTPKEKLQEYYCKRQDGSLLIGQHFNVDLTLDYIERLDNWKDIKFSSPLCTMFYSVLVDLKNNQKILIHCNAGRDRTGAFVAILMALLFEGYYNTTVTSDFIQAIECDYRKTSSLKTIKFGTITNMLNNIISSYSSISGFLEHKCYISKNLIQQASKNIFLTTTNK